MNIPVDESAEGEDGSRAHLRNFVLQQLVQLLVGVVSGPAPPGWLVVVPDPPDGDGQPLPQNSFFVVEVFKANCDLEGKQVMLNFRHQGLSKKEHLA